MPKFHKVSYSQFAKEFESMSAYENIKLPARSTEGSAGYDFYSPFPFVLRKGEGIRIPTGIKCEMPNDMFLAIYPRSSIGINYRARLDNTCGIIDASYYNNESNEGHIMCQITNGDVKDLVVEQGDRLFQGIFQKYYVVDDDEPIQSKRAGGFGSTGV